MKTDDSHRQWVLDALDQYESRLLRYAQRLLGGGNAGSATDEGRDVVQFVFLKLCDQTESNLNDRLAQWLYTVCRNRAMDVLRARGRTVGWDKAVSAAAGPPLNGKSVGRRELRSLVPPYEDNPADLVEQADLHALLRTLIEHLPTNQREALDLWADGFNYLQIADITNHSEGHIRVLVHRGLKALREHPRVKLLTDDEPTPTRRPSEHEKTPTPSVSEENSSAAQRRNHVAVGAIQQKTSPRKTEPQENKSPEGATP